MPIANIIDLTTDDPTAVSMVSSLVGVSEIEIYIEAFSTNTDNQAPLIQIGDSGGLETSGYTGIGMSINSTPTYASDANGAGFLLSSESLFDATGDGDFMIRLIHLGSNVWSLSANSSNLVGGTTLQMAVGVKTLSAALDRVSITTTGGTAEIDGGTALVRSR